MFSSPAFYSPQIALSNLEESLDENLRFVSGRDENIIKQRGRDHNSGSARWITSSLSIFFTFWVNSIFSSSLRKSTQQVVFFLQVVKTRTRTPFPSDLSRDEWKNWHLKSCLRTFSRLHQCSVLSLKSRWDTHHVPILTALCKLYAVVHAQREPENLPTAQQWL